MTLIKSTNSLSSKPLQWPRQLSTPSELVQALRLRTKLRIIRSPLCSKLVLQFIGSWAYLLANVLNKSRVFNVEVFNRELARVESKLKMLESAEQDKRQLGSLDGKAPLLTLSNHISCIDDPILWATLLPLTYYSTHTESVRWSAAALEICFSKPWHSTFFALGKTFPIVRGDGLNQPAMDFMSALLRYNQWLHLFPEGKVMRDDKQRVISNRERGYVFKWGISELILNHFKTANDNKPISSEKQIRILPFYHLGMDDILPIGWPYIPRFGKKITVYMRPSVIEMNRALLANILGTRTLSNRCIKSRSNDDIKRIKLTEYLEEEVEKLIEPTTRLHNA